MTLAEITTRVSERLDEDAVTSQRYTPANVEEYVLDGVRFFVARTGCQVSSYVVTQDAETLLYDLPCDLIQVERVLWNNGGVYYPLAPTLARELDAQWYLWQRQYDTRARAYFLLGLDRIALWPLSSAGGEDYIIYYQQDNYDSVNRVPVESHECLVDYAVARCLLAEGKVDGMQEYERYMKEVKAAQRRMASPDRVWSQGRRIV